MDADRQKSPPGTNSCLVGLRPCRVPRLSGQRSSARHCVVAVVTGLLPGMWLWDPWHAAGAEAQQWGSHCRDEAWWRQAGSSWVYMWERFQEVTSPSSHLISLRAQFIVVHAVHFP